jgi:hypothetical protein
MIALSGIDAMKEPIRAERIAIAALILFSAFGLVLVAYS